MQSHALDVHHTTTMTTTTDTPPQTAIAASTPDTATEDHNTDKTHVPRSPAIAAVDVSGTGGETDEPSRSLRPSSPLAPPRSVISAVSADSRADSVDSTTIETGLTKTGRKPKKKGWKGYAMQYFDEDGKMIEERKRDETPPSDSAEPPAPVPLGRGARTRIVKEVKPKQVRVKVQKKRAVSELTLSSDSRPATPGK